MFQNESMKGRGKRPIPTNRGDLSIDTIKAIGARTGQHSRSPEPDAEADHADTTKKTTTT